MSIFKKKNNTLNLPSDETQTKNNLYFNRKDMRPVLNATG